ncbi:MAG: Mur ligase domain-containing protein, partial [Aquiluna sp.]
MIALTLAELATAVSGEIFRGDPDRVVSGPVETDSREIVSGGIFFAKLGENEDGHKYLVDALLSGATLAVVSSPSADTE